MDHVALAKQWNTFPHEVGHELLKFTGVVYDFYLWFSPTLGDEMVSILRSAGLERIAESRDCPPGWIPIEQADTAIRQAASTFRLGFGLWSTGRNIDEPAVPDWLGAVSRGDVIDGSDFGSFIAAVTRVAEQVSIETPVAPAATETIPLSARWYTAAEIGEALKAINRPSSTNTVTKFIKSEIQNGRIEREGKNGPMRIRNDLRDELNLNP